VVGKLGFIIEIWFLILRMKDQENFHMSTLNNKRDDNTYFPRGNLEEIWQNLEAWSVIWLCWSKSSATLQKRSANPGAQRCVNLHYAKIPRPERQARSAAPPLRSAALGQNLQNHNTFLFFSQGFLEISFYSLLGSLIFKNDTME